MCEILVFFFEKKKMKMLLLSMMMSVASAEDLRRSDRIAKSGSVGG